jgi:hypothetical protein
MQEQFIKFLKAKSNDTTSFVDELASVLDVGYDAAYRRINLKTSLSLEETVKLARHYKVSLNKLFEVGDTDSILTEISQKPNNEQALELWFKQTLNNAIPLTKIKNAEMIWSGKDISLFRSLNDSHLTRYKMYVWLKDLHVDMAKSKISFDDWMTTIPDSLIESAIELGNIYKHINITELWNDNTINGTLQQVLYYFEAGLVSKDITLRICDDLHEIVNHIEKETIQQTINDLENEKFFRLYKHDLHTLTNTVMLITPFQKAFFTPFTVLSYFKIEHKETCDMMHEFLQKQMSNSKLLATSGERDRTIFFKTIHQKISIAKQRIDIDDKMTFL